MYLLLSFLIFQPPVSQTLSCMVPDVPRDTTARYCSLACWRCAALRWRLLTSQAPISSPFSRQALEDLLLANCPRVSDTGLSYLAGLAGSLKTLNLENCARITDAGLGHVSQLPLLQVCCCACWVYGCS